ncbi:unnamed protein product [Phytomonas sp. Hart1]|nr:unnamed protein product [Phytomonas sp. Hart1]|eukprot:CCW71962.1 unnamed protein product [Phytomonas sp. isolate Hart1]
MTGTAASRLRLIKAILGSFFFPRRALAVCLGPNELLEPLGSLWVAPSCSSAASLWLSKDRMDGMFGPKPRGALVSTGPAISLAGSSEMAGEEPSRVTELGFSISIGSAGYGISGPSLCEVSE